MKNKMNLESQVITSSVSYLQTFPWLLKCIQLICNTILLIIEEERFCWRMHIGESSYFIASIGSLVICSIIVFIKIRNIDKRINNIPWNNIEVSYYITWSVYYFVAMSQARSSDVKISDIFALISVITFMVDVSMCYKEMNNVTYSSGSNLKQQDEGSTKINLLNEEQV